MRRRTHRITKQAESLKARPSGGSQFAAECARHQTGRIAFSRDGVLAVLDEVDEDGRACESRRTAVLPWYKPKVSKASV